MFIFAFLFGYGAELQFRKWGTVSLFNPYWYRRMSILALFGLVHIMFFWFGDILLPYAILGFSVPYWLKQKANIVDKPICGKDLNFENLLRDLL